MPTRAENVTPGQTRHFRVEIEGINPFQIQQTTNPDVEHDVVEASDGQSMIKFPGLTKTGDLVIKDFVDAFNADDEIWIWLFANGDPVNGNAVAPYDKRDGSIFRTDAAGNDIQQWKFTGAWAKKIGGYSFDKEKSEKLMREAIISVDTFRPVF